MRVMYNECSLVHADFSEYNILYNKGELVVIDVGQAIEHDHPMALEFLRRDCININDFFNKKGVKTLLCKDLFNFIVKYSDKMADIKEAVKLVRNLSNAKEKTAEDMKEEETFKRIEFKKITKDDDVDYIIEHEANIVCE